MTYSAKDDKTLEALLIQHAQNSRDWETCAKDEPGLMLHIAKRSLVSMHALFAHIEGLVNK